MYIQYRNIEDASIAWGYMKDELYKDQLMKIEFKRKQDKKELSIENHPIFLNDTAKQLWNQMLVFKNTFIQNRGSQVPSLIFPNDLSAYALKVGIMNRFEKSIVFTYTEKLGLCHYTQGDGEDKHIIISNTPPSSQSLQRASSGNRSKNGRSSRAGSLTDISVPAKEEVPQRRPRRASCPDLFSSSSRPVNQKQNPTMGNTQRVALGPEEGSIGFALRRSIL